MQKKKSHENVGWFQHVAEIGLQNDFNSDMCIVLQVELLSFYPCNYFIKINFNLFIKNAIW